MILRNTETIQSRAEKVVKVFNLPPQTDSEMVANLGRMFGLVVHASVIQKTETEAPGLSTIYFKSAKVAEAACRQLNGESVKGHKLFVRRVCDEGEISDDESKRTVRLTNLPPIIPWEKVKELASPYGTVLYAKVLQRRNQELYGTGLVLFQTEKEAQIAAKALNLKSISGQKIAAESLGQSSDHENKENKSAKLQ